MISILNIYNQPTEYRGLSTDEKPISNEVKNGDTFSENKKFMLKLI